MRFRGLVFLSVAVAIVVTTSVQGYEISGIWTGKRSCVGLGTDHGKISIKNANSTLFVFQSGKYVNLERDGFAPYHGLAVANLVKPAKGELGILGCGTGDSFTSLAIHEAGRLAVSTNPATGKATLRGSSVETFSFFDDEVMTCKWSYKRAAVSFPSVPDCFE
jgi:hypothetical protein